MISKAQLQDLYPLSPMQEAMLFHALAHPESLAYFEQFGYRITGRLNLDAFVRTWNALFARHDILRTAFISEKTRRPLQAVLKDRRPEVHFEDLCGCGPDDREGALERFREEEKRRGFDLSSDVLLRIKVVRLWEETFEVMVSFHHILMDGWCMGILHSEFQEIYQALEAGRPPALGPVVPYSRYIQWLEQRDREASLRYWKQYLAGYETPATLLREVPNAEGQPYRLRRLVTVWDEHLTRRIHTAAADWGITDSIFFQGVWGLLLSRYADSSDVVFGAVVSGRPPELPAVEKMVGLFISLIPVRVRAGNEDFRTLLSRLQDEHWAGIPHSYCVIGDVLGSSPLHERLLDHIVVFENYPLSAATQAGGLAIENTHHFEQTNYNFLVVIAPGPSTEVAFHYNASVYDDAAIGRLMENFRQAAEAALANPPLRDLEVIAPSEQRLWREFNRTELPFPQDKTLVEVFEQQVSAGPARKAIVEGSRHCSYAECNALANGLANRLAGRGGIQTEEPVGVLLPRSRWLPVAFLGVLKAGGVYLPLDPEAPPERIRSMLEDAGCRVAVTDVRGMASLGAVFGGAVWDVTRVEPADALATRPRLDHSNLAYLIYTSGSTGRPKGVMVSHRSALNLAAWHQRCFEAGPDSRATLFASPGFDASIWEMLPYLLSGGCLYPLDDAARQDVETLIGFCREHGITHSFVPPSICESLCRSHCGRLGGRIKLLAGGDVLRDIGSGDVEVINNYGPTESAVVATSGVVRAETRPIPIGRPIDNTEILILDHDGHGVPVGATGELYIGSAGLARGYWKRPALTAERFVPHPSRRGERLYRTGDRGAWQADGTIVFAGRGDRQVKVRGFRIELGEIESVLGQHPGVAECAAIVRNRTGDETEIAAYVAPRSNPVAPAELREFLARRLPAAMLPSVFVSLASLPRNASGKLDRLALAGLDPRAPARKRARAAPRTDVQKQLAEIWEQVLGVERVGVHDSFFELGGHSLKATRIMSQVRDKFKVDLPLRALFDNLTIARLEEAIEHARRSAAPGMEEPPLVPRPRMKRTGVRDSL